MDKYIKTVVFTLLFTAQSFGQGIDEISINLGGGHVFYFSPYVANKLSENYLGGNLQLFFQRKENISFGLQAGAQRVVVNNYLTQYGWGSQYQGFQPNNIPTSPSESNQSIEMESKYYFWQFLFLSKYQFTNSILLEGSIGAILEIPEGSTKLNINPSSLIGFGGGYQLKITNSLSIPFKIKADYVFLPSTGNGPLYLGLYSGVVFNLVD